METYSGWTAKDIQEAEEAGDYIPDSVWTSYLNGEPDGSDLNYESDD